MNLENLRKALKKKGIACSIIVVYKNGIPIKGFRLNTDNPTVSPIIYCEEGESEDAFVKRAQEAVGTSYEFKPKFLHDKDYIRKNVFLSVQKRSCEKTLKRALLNLEVVVRLLVDTPQKNADHTGTIKITPSFLDLVKMNPDEIWDNAIQNSKERLTIHSMNELLGFPLDDSNPFYVAISDDGTFGASALAFPELFEDFCNKHQVDHIWILPSSTQEVLILPDDSQSFTPEMLSSLVADVNQTAVEDIIQLDPVVYEYDMKDSGFIRIANEEVCYG